MPTPRNWIVLQSDNHNRRVLGCYGHPVVRTPHLDALAARGTRFANAYASSPLCSPSRASIANGRWPHQTGYWDNGLVYDGRVPSWMHRFHQAGHHTCAIGKLHFRSEQDDTGFDEQIAPMHIFEGKGDLLSLLRWSDEEPLHPGHWELFRDETGVGESHYQDYDRAITQHAIRWLTEEAPKHREPWVLYVSYVSAHPPLTVPQRLWDLYPVEDMPLPVAFRPGERPEHPAYQQLRKVLGFQDMTDETMLRRVAAGYFALVTHLDEQIGEVLGAAEGLGLLDEARVLYTTDHGESFGNHGLFNKCQLLETAAAVPLLLAGPDVPQGHVVQQVSSLTDLFPTLCEGGGVPLAPEDADLPGTSLWPAFAGQEAERLGFAEYHATGSRNGSFLVRRGAHKLIYHVGMRPEVFDLAADPWELRNLAETPQGQAIAKALEAELRDICDPEAVDRRAKADQRAQAERFGGNEAIRNRGSYRYSPPPGVKPTFFKQGEAGGH